MVDRLAEGDYPLDLRCPRCEALIETVVRIGSQLTVPSDGVATVAPKIKALKVPHFCGQGALFELDHSGRVDG
jgi:hypothetical protein